MAKKDHSKERDKKIPVIVVDFPDFWNRGFVTDDANDMKQIFSSFFGDEWKSLI